MTDDFPKRTSEPAGAQDATPNVLPEDASTEVLPGYPLVESAYGPPDAANGVVSPAYVQSLPGGQWYAPQEGAGQSYQASPNQPAMAQRKPGSGFALTALILGIVALVLFWVPVIGVLIAVPGLVFGILALVRRQPSGMTVAGVVLSGVALLASIAMTAAVISEGSGNSQNRAGGSVAAEDGDHSPSAESEERPESGENNDGVEDAGGSGAPEMEEVADGGTRANPLPIGTEIRQRSWVVTVNSVEWDATAEVVAENMFNDEPEAGAQYALVNVTATYEGVRPGGATPELEVEYVTAAGNTVDEWDAFVVAPDEFDSSATLYEGASETGNIVLQVPSDDVGKGVLAVQAAHRGDKVFVSMQ